MSAPRLRHRAAVGRRVALHVVSTLLVRPASADGAHPVVEVTVVRRVVVFLSGLASAAPRE